MPSLLENFTRLTDLARKTSTESITPAFITVEDSVTVSDKGMAFQKMRWAIQRKIPEHNLVLVNDGQMAVVLFGEHAVLGFSFNDDGTLQIVDPGYWDMDLFQSLVEVIVHVR